MRPFAALALLALIACASTSTSSQQNGTITSPTDGAQVDVALAAARLGEENCTHDESKDVATKACAAPPPGTPPPRGTGLCGSPCIFSNVQLSFTAPANGKTAHVQIVSASLVDAATGAQVQALSAYTPLAWNGTTYVDWDENVAPGTEVKSSYTLSPPTWSQIDPSRNYSRQYKYVIVVGLDGGTTTVESPAMTRDPPVAT